MKRAARYFLGLIAAYLLLGNAYAKDYGQGLGRLLTTESERARFDEIRFSIAPTPKAAATAEDVISEPSMLHIQGLTQRPDMPIGKRYTIWIDGKPYQENELPFGLRLKRDKDGSVLGIESKVDKDKTEFAHIGDTITRPQSPEEAKALKQKADEAAAALKNAEALDLAASVKEKAAVATELAKGLATSTIDKAKNVFQNLRDSVKN